MGARAALVSGTVLSVAAVSAWSYTASLTIGPAAPLHLTRNPLADYAELADAPAGNGRELFAVIAVIYVLCLLASGWRQQQRRHAEGDG
jgi:hypothetical protein